MTLKTRWHRFGYGLAIGRPNWLRDKWGDIWFRFYCPRPVIENPTARACIAAGECGCSNGDQ